MKKFLVFLCAMLLFFGSVGYANAIKIGSYNSTLNIGFRDIFPTSVDVDVENIGGTVFDDLEISSSDVGTEFLISSATDTGFNGVTSVITNGIDNAILLWMLDPVDGGGVGSGPTESQAFGTAPDFAGYAVDMLGLEVIAINFNEIEHPVQGTYVSGTFNFNVYGSSVPEPATMLLLGTGLIGLAVFGRKRFLKK